MEILINIIQIVGCLAGFIALLWNFFNLKKNYLTLRLKVKTNKNKCIVQTEIENKNPFKKVINKAFLIIVPENYSVISAACKISNYLNLNVSINNVTDIESLNLKRSCYFKEKYAIIPLPYYYDGTENIQIADEKITYNCSVDLSKLKKGNYSVRFYLFSKGRYPRSTQDLLIVKTTI